MFTLTDCKKFKDRFAGITGQNVEDWTCHEAVEAAGQEHNPQAVGQAIDGAIVGEIANRVEYPRFIQASYIRDLAQLLCELRSAML